MQKVSEKIIKKRFPQVKGGLLGGSPGLEPASVNFFLQEILEDVKGLEKRNDELESQVRLQSESAPAEYPQATQSLAQSAAITMTTADVPADLLEMREELERGISKIEHMEEFYKRMILRGEAELEMMKEEAREKAGSIIEEAAMRADNLVREANSRYEEKAREAAKMIEQADDVKRKLQSIAKFIESAV
jgi:cell division septum initiation protein DivIVA